VDAQLLTDRGAPTTLFCGHDTSGPFRHRREALQAAGATVTMINTDASGRLKLADALGRIFGASNAELLVESGPTLAASFLAAADGVDRVWVVHSPTRMDDPTAPAAAEIPGHFVESGRLDLGGDTLIEYLNPSSLAFFANTPSADLVLARS
jgi:riboflavin biosynthesis pyrimidine reductase